MSHRLLFVFVFVFSVLCSSSYGVFDSWLNHGGGNDNRRHARYEWKIRKETISRMSLKWKFFAGFDITATPAVYNGVVYFPTWDGNLFAVRAVDGSLVWKINLQNLTGISPIDFQVPRAKPTVLSRTTPTVTPSTLFIGLYGPAYIVAVQRLTGKLLWSTQLETHNASLVTMSGTYHNGGFYVGTSSLEESVKKELCCTFRGSFSKLNALTGQILWKTYMLPDNNGEKYQYAGSSIWGSSPAIDVARNLIFIATGNLYSVPPSVASCQEKENNQPQPSHQEQCIEQGINGNSILALDLDDGSISWSQQLGGYDVWLLVCVTSPDSCPAGPNLDADFGEAPMTLTVVFNSTVKDIVVATQKSGYTWALDRSNGELVWSTKAGPGGLGGGGIWGSATDGKRVYTNIANTNKLNFTLLPDTAEITTAGGWVAMDADTGAIQWSTGNPNNFTSPGPVTIANGILFAGSADASGEFYAMDAVTGEILWSYETGASIVGGASVSNGCAFVGTGRGFFGSQYTSGTSLFAFCVTDD